MLEGPQFEIARKGYNREAVDEFASETSEQIQTLQAELEAARLEASNAAQRAADLAAAAVVPAPLATEAERRSEAYRLVSAQTTKILEAAEQVAEEIRQRATRESIAVVADARRDSAMATQQADAGLKELEQELNRLRHTRRALADQLEEVRKRVSDTVAQLQGPLQMPIAGSARTTEVPVPEKVPEAVAKSPAPPSQEVPEVAAPPAPRAEPAPRPVVEPAPAPEKQETGPAPLKNEEAQKPRKVEDPVDALLKEIREATPQAPPAEDAEAQAEQPLEPDAGEEEEIQPEVALRNEALGNAPAEAARRLKRMLQEDQNDLLDRLRTQRGKGAAEENISSEQDQFIRFSNSLGELLNRMYAQGRQVGGGAGEGKPGLQVSNLVSRQVVAPLRSELLKVIEAGLAAGDTSTAIAERAGDVYRVWKGVRTELLGEGMVFAAFHQGLLEAWTADDRTSRKSWILAGDEDHCPGDVCKQNAAEGAVQVQAPFPSGHMAPPAHGGCGCTLATVKLSKVTANG